MKSNETIVRFSVSGIEIRGEVVRTGDDRRKIVFIAGYKPETASSWRGTLPENDSVWVVDVIRDTKPDQIFRGALIVRLVRQVRWALQPVGEAVHGVREMRPVCFDDEGLSSIYCQSFTRQEIETANEPWREAQAQFQQEQEAVKAIEWTWQYGDTVRFLETFGRPISVCQREGGEVSLSYARGEKTLRHGSEILSWLKHISQLQVDSWRWDQQAQSVMVTFTVAELGVEISLEVFCLKDLVSGSLRREWAEVDSSMKAEIISFVWENNLLTAFEWAERRWAGWWEYSAPRISKEVEPSLLALAHPGESALGHQSWRGQEEVTASYGDERWGTGRYVDRTYSQPYLLCGVSEARGYSWYGPVGCYSVVCHSHTVEDARQEILGDAMRHFAESILKDNWIVPPLEFFQDEQAKEAWRDSYRQAYIAARRESRAIWWGELAEKMAQDKEAWELSKQLDARADTTGFAVRRPLPKGQNLGEIRQELAMVSLMVEHKREMDDFRTEIQTARSFFEWHDLDLELRRATDERLATHTSVPSTVEEMEAWRAESEALLVELEAKRIELQRQREEAAQAKAKARAETAMRDLLPQQGAEERLEIDPRIIAWAEVIKEIVGVRMGIDILRGEFEAPYGRAGRQRGVADGVPGLDESESGAIFLRMSRARDVNAWLEGAISILGTRIQEPAAEPQPTVGKVVTFADIGKRWFRCDCGTTQRVSKGDALAYQAGGTLELTCAACGGHGNVRR
ncbi:MAG: hypothetical protein COU34_03780 [Candidatus Magasanikbacteria bacterium CG10_big_fil_rev_8_21_14_0_10_43_9]|nr:MAG: hypothetical protein COU34_03780 [Candidatus Magasanikbacteria bacterium CG10_big_fil_rev_8_21_14_0_10_43_9]